MFNRKGFVVVALSLLIVLAGMKTSLVSAAGYYYSITGIRLVRCDETGGVLIWDAIYNVPPSHIPTRFQSIIANGPGEFGYYYSLGTPVDSSRHIESRAMVWTITNDQYFEDDPEYHFQVLLSATGKFNGEIVFGDHFKFDVRCRADLRSATFSNISPPYNP